MKFLNTIKNLFSNQSSKKQPMAICNNLGYHNARLYINEDLFPCEEVYFFQSSNNACGYGEIRILLLDTKYQTLMNKKAKLCFIATLNNKDCILYSAQIRFHSSETLKATKDNMALTAVLGFSVLTRDLVKANEDVV